MAQLRVNFDGIVAWVPVPGQRGPAVPRSYSVLLPEALFADRASWIQPRQNRYPHVREPHTALFLFDYPPGSATTGPIDAVVADCKNQNPRGVVRLDRRKVKFDGLAKQPLTQVHGCGQWPFESLPHMAEISPRHRWVQSRFDPGSRGFDPRRLGLAAALEIDRGNLAVTQRFDDGRNVQFGLVKSCLGKLGFSSRVWDKPVGNKVEWTALLAADSVSIFLDDKLYQLTPGADGEVKIAFTNAELEVPVFRRTYPDDDPKKDGMPDPDFEVLYRLSAARTRKERRVPVPVGGGSGSREKPCAPAVFSGFK